MKIFLKKNWIWLLLLIVAGCHIALLSQIIFFPYPELFIYPYLTKAGLIPYKQIFDQHFPGIMFFPVNLATLGMDTPMDARFWQYGSVITSHIIIFLIGRKLFKSNFLTILGNLLYLLWQPFFEGYVLWIETFVTPILMISFYLFLVKRKDSFFYSGFFLGLALLFKQVVGPLVVMLTVYLFFVSNERKNIYAFVFGATVPVFFLIIWVSYLGIWLEFIYWTVTFNLTTFAEMGRKLPDFPSIVRSFLVFGVATLMTLISFVRAKFLGKRNKTLELLFIFFVGTLVFAFARWDYIHLQPTLPFSIFLILLAIRRLDRRRLVLISVMYLFFALLLLIPFYKASYGKRVLFYGDTEMQISDEVGKYADIGESVFAFGTFPHLYQMTNTLPPLKVFVFQFPWFMVQAEDIIYRGIIIDPPKVVVRDKEAEVAGVNLVSFMPKINNYIERYYRVVGVINGSEIMIKN